MVNNKSCETDELLFRWKSRKNCQLRFRPLYHCQQYHGGMCSTVALFEVMCVRAKSHWPVCKDLTLEVGNPPKMAVCMTSRGVQLVVCLISMHKDKRFYFCWFGPLPYSFSDNIWLLPSWFWKATHRKYRKFVKQCSFSCPAAFCSDCRSN